MRRILKVLPIRSCSGSRHPTCPTLCPGSLEGATRGRQPCPGDLGPGGEHEREGLGATSQALWRLPGWAAGWATFGSWPPWEHRVLDPFQAQ